MKTLLKRLLKLSSIMLLSFLALLHSDRNGFDVYAQLEAVAVEAVAVEPLVSPTLSLTNTTFNTATVDEQQSFLESVSADDVSTLTTLDLNSIDKTLLTAEVLAALADPTYVTGETDGNAWTGTKPIFEFDKVKYKVNYCNSAVEVGLVITGKDGSGSSFDATSYWNSNPDGGIFNSTNSEVYAKDNNDTCSPGKIVDVIIPDSKRYRDLCYVVGYRKADPDDPDNLTDWIIKDKGCFLDSETPIPDLTPVEYESNYVSGISWQGSTPVYAEEGDRIMLRVKNCNSADKISFIMTGNDNETHNDQQFHKRAKVPKSDYKCCESDSGVSGLSLYKNLYGRFYNSWNTGINFDFSDDGDYDTDARKYVVDCQDDHTYSFYVPTNLKWKGVCMAHAWRHGVYEKYQDELDNPLSTYRNCWDVDFVPKPPGEIAGEFEMEWEPKTTSDGYLGGSEFKLGDTMSAKIKVNGPNEQDLKSSQMTYLFMDMYDADGNSQACPTPSAGGYYCSNPDSSTCPYSGEEFGGFGVANITDLDFNNNAQQPKHFYDPNGVKTYRFDSVVTTDKNVVRKMKMCYSARVTVEAYPGDISSNGSWSTPGEIFPNLVKHFEPDCFYMSSSSSDIKELNTSYNSSFESDSTLFGDLRTPVTYNSIFAENSSYMEENFPQFTICEADGSCNPQYKTYQDQWPDRVFIDAWCRNTFAETMTLNVGLQSSLERCDSGVTDDLCLEAYKLEQDANNTTVYNSWGKPRTLQMGAYENGINKVISGNGGSYVNVASFAVRNVSDVFLTLKDYDLGLIFRSAYLSSDSSDYDKQKLTTAGKEYREHFMINQNTENGAQFVVGVKASAEEGDLQCEVVFDGQTDLYDPVNMIYFSPGSEVNFQLQLKPRADDLGNPVALPPNLTIPIAARATVGGDEGLFKEVESLEAGTITTVEGTYEHEACDNGSCTCAVKVFPRKIAKNQITITPTGTPELFSKIKSHYYFDALNSMVKSSPTVVEDGGSFYKEFEDVSLGRFQIGKDAPIRGIYNMAAYDLHSRVPSGSENAIIFGNGGALEVPADLHRKYDELLVVGRVVMGSKATANSPGGIALSPPVMYSVVDPLKLEATGIFYTRTGDSNDNRLIDVYTAQAENQEEVFIVFEGILKKRRITYSANTQFEGLNDSWVPDRSYYGYTGAFKEATFMSKYKTVDYVRSGETILDRFRLYGGIDYVVPFMETSCSNLLPFSLPTYFDIANDGDTAKYELIRSRAMDLMNKNFCRYSRPYTINEVVNSGVNLKMLSMTPEAPHQQLPVSISRPVLNESPDVVVTPTGETVLATSKVMAVAATEAADEVATDADLTASDTSTSQETSSVGEIAVSEGGDNACTGEIVDCWKLPQNYLPPSLKGEGHAPFATHQECHERTCKEEQVSYDCGKQNPCKTKMNVCQDNYTAKCLVSEPNESEETGDSLNLRFAGFFTQAVAALGCVAKYDQLIMPDGSLAVSGNEVSSDAQLMGMDLEGVSVIASLENQGIIPYDDSAIDIGDDEKQPGFNQSVKVVSGMPKASLGGAVPDLYSNYLKFGVSESTISNFPYKRKAFQKAHADVASTYSKNQNYKKFHAQWNGKPDGMPTDAEMQVYPDFYNRYKYWLNIFLTDIGTSKDLATEKNKYGFACVPCRFAGINGDLDSTSPPIFAGQSNGVADFKQGIYTFEKDRKPASCTVKQEFKIRYFGSAECDPNGDNPPDHFCSQPGYPFNGCSTSGQADSFSRLGDTSFGGGAANEAGKFTIRLCPNTALTGKPLAVSWSPIVLDIDGTGIDISRASAEAIEFDINGDGKKENIDWPINNEGTAFLVRPDKDGKVNSVHELFGDAKARNGFEALREYDSNKDGFITKKDKRFNELRLWFDVNRNGIVDDASELSTLPEKGVNQIHLKYYKRLGVSGPEGRHLNSTYFNAGNKKFQNIVDAYFRAY